jgi:hypothetical protein
VVAEFPSDEFHVSPEGVAEAVCVMRELAEVLDRTAPLADVPFALVPEVRRESKREADARQAGLF